MPKRTMRHLGAIAALATLSITLLGTSSASAATVGSLKQLASPSGCVVDASAPVPGCATGRSLLGVAPFFGSHAVAVSPDGKSLYAVAFNSETIATFARSSRTGKLKQLAATPGRGMIKPTSVDVSPDGRSVYVASIIGSSIASFARNTKTGKLTQLSGQQGCISAETGNICATGRAMKGADVVAVSPDGRHVYAGAFESDALLAFTRNSRTGAITQQPGTKGCVTQVATSGCATGRGLNGAEGLTISPDGKSVYVGAAVGNAVAVFRRDPKAGTVSQATGTTGCAAFQANEGCANGDGLIGADSMQVSPDNKNLYVASGVGSSIAAFKRNARTGNLTQLGGVAGCYVDRKRSLGRCNSGVEIDGPEGIAVSPDGRTVYVGSYFSGSVTVFDRTSFTGTITQRSGVHGCFVSVATSGCTTANALVNANALAISPDGRSVYVGSYGSNGLAIFDRAEPKAGHVTVTLPSKLGVPNGSVVSIPLTCSGTAGRRCPGGISIALNPGASGARRGGSFNIAVGKSEDVSVVMPSDVRRALASDGRVTVTVTVRVVQPSGRIDVSRQQLRLGVSELG